MSERFEVAVIGGGIVGVSTALHLLMRGVKVVLIDRGSIERATSYGNAGFIETSYVLPFSLPALKRFPRIALNQDAAVHLHYLHLPKCMGWIFDFYQKSQPEPRKINGRLLRPLIASSVEEHKTLMQGTEAERYFSSHGRVRLHRTEESFLGSALERRVAQELGVPFEVLTAAEFSEIEPHLKPVYTKAVRWNSSARLTNPGAVITAYINRFVREGGKLVAAEVRKLNNQNGWSVETSAGEIQSEQAVLCTGPWADDLYKPLGYRFPLGIKRGYHQHFAPIGETKLSHGIVDGDVGYVMCQMEHGVRLTTGAEFADIDAPATPVQIQQILPHARELLPIGDAVEPKAWLGNRPCFTDSLPVVGPAPHHKGLWFNFGHGHSGLTIGPSTGRLLAEMMRGEKPFCDPRPYHAERFTG